MQADQEQGLEQEQRKHAADRHDRNVLPFPLGHEQNCKHGEQCRQHYLEGLCPGWRDDHAVVLDVSEQGCGDL